MTWTQLNNRKKNKRVQIDRGSSLIITRCNGWIKTKSTSMCFFFVNMSALSQKKTQNDRFKMVCKKGYIFYSESVMFRKSTAIFFINCFFVLSECYFREHTMFIKLFVKSFRSEQIYRVQGNDSQKYQLREINIA